MRVGLLIFVFCLPFCVYAESTDEYGRLRLKNAYWFGPAVTTGYLDATADAATTKIRLTSLAGIRVGMERWPEENMGVLLMGEFGLPAQLANVLDNEVRFTRHQLTAGLTYRYFMGPKPLASAISLSSMMTSTVEDVQEQQPVVIVSRFILSPTLRLGYERFLIGDSTWMRATVGVGYPFFVREDPSDSGRPDSMFDARASFFICHYLSPRWGLELGAEHMLQYFQHSGEATRGGGVNDVRVSDYFTTGYLNVRYVPSN